MLQDLGMLVFVGPAYQQASQMAFAPSESAIVTPLVNPQTQTKGNIGVTQPIGMTVSPQFAAVYTNSTPMDTHAQGGFMTGFPVG